METFVMQKNIERYRRILADPRDEVQRRIVLKLLTEEEVTLKEHARRRNRAVEGTASGWLAIRDARVRGQSNRDEVR
jgi:hypothetical protein